MDQEKILTRDEVIKLGLDKVQVITADMLEGYTNIEGYAFSNCISLTSIEIPNSVTNIEDYAFFYCINLISVTIPNSVTNIRSFAFYDCIGLTSITIPNSVTSIENYAFCNCIGLTSVTIPNSVIRIGNSAFANCKNLISIEIPNSVTHIGAFAFWNCICLTSVTIPNRIIIIGNNAFDGCSYLTSVIIEDKTYKSQVIKDGKYKAYKAFNSDMTCRDFQYEEGKTYEFNGKPKMCEQGFHACLNLTDVFNYYAGQINKDIVVHEVELEDVSDESCSDSKVVAKKITIGKRIL